MDGKVKIIVKVGSMTKEVEVTGLQDTLDKIEIIREILNSDNRE